MGKYGDKARALFHEGYNCAQAVVGAFCDDMGLDVKTAVRIASPFGGGMGRLREVCGSFSGIVFVLGYFYGYDDPKAFDEKKELYDRVQELARRFKREQGSIVCRELLGLDEKHSAATPEKRTAQYYQKRPCSELTAFAADILAEYMEEFPPRNVKKIKTI